jgi:hypothetical protein
MPASVPPRGPTASGSGARAQLESTPSASGGSVPPGTLVSPSAQEGARVAAADPQRPRMLVVALVAAITAAIAAFVAARSMTTTKGTTSPAEVTALPVAPTQPPPPVQVATAQPPTVTPAAPTQAPTAAETAAPSASLTAAPLRGKLGAGPLHGAAGRATAQPATTAAPKEKKGDDDIPSMR